MKEKNKFIEQLRTLSKVKNKERTWISDLSDERLYDIFLRLRAHETAASISRYAQTAWKIKPTSTIHSLSQGVTKFRLRISHLLIMTPPPGNAICDVDFEQELISDITSVRMERMALDIEARINKIMAEEKNTGIHFPYLNRDIQALASLRKSILKQRDWELQHEDLIQDENEKNIQKNIKKKFDKLMNVLGDDGQKRLVRMTTQFLEMADKIAVPMAVDAEGNFVRVDEDN